MAKLLYQGHGSFRIESADGRIIYVDPYAGEGYDLPADLILVTHQHGDHNAVSRAAKKTDCRIIAEGEALAGDKHNVISPWDGLTVEAVEAKNHNHDPRKCVGYLIVLDGVAVYAAGDTSRTDQMERLAERRIDYALLPGDGIYNMDLDEAAECARIIGARHNIPIHLKPGALFSRERAEAFGGPNRLIVEPGEEIELK